MMSGLFFWFSYLSTVYTAILYCTGNISITLPFIAFQSLGSAYWFAVKTKHPLVAPKGAVLRRRISQLARVVEMRGFEPRSKQTLLDTSTSLESQI